MNSSIPSEADRLKQARDIGGLRGRSVAGTLLLKPFMHSPGPCEHFDECDRPGLESAVAHSLSKALSR